MASLQQPNGIPRHSNPAMSEVWVYTGAAVGGSVNTMIRVFSLVGRILGGDIKYIPNNGSGLGDAFEVTQDGTYTVSYTDAGTSTANFGISKNTTEGSTAIYSINPLDTLGFISSSAGAPINISVTTYLLAGDVIRAHNDGATDRNDNGVQFRICRLS